MPYVNAYVDTQVEVDIDVDDFLSECSSKEISQICRFLQEEGYVMILTVNEENPRKLGIAEEEFINKLNNLKEIYYTLKPEDEDTLNKIFSKYL